MLAWVILLAPFLAGAFFDGTVGATNSFKIGQFVWGIFSD